MCVNLSGADLERFLQWEREQSAQRKTNLDQIASRQSKTIILVAAAFQSAMLELLNEIFADLPDLGDNNVNPFAREIAMLREIEQVKVVATRPAIEKPHHNATLDAVTFGFGAPVVPIFAGRKPKEDDDEDDEEDDEDSEIAFRRAA